MIAYNKSLFVEAEFHGFYRKAHERKRSVPSDLKILSAIAQQYAFVFQAEEEHLAASCSEQEKRE
jgi:hypothetical protein